MTKKVIYAILIPMVIYSIIFGFLYLRDISIIRKHEEIENSVIDTNLSSFSISGYKLGQPLEFITEFALSITTDDGEYYKGFLDKNQDIKTKGAKIVRMSADSRSTYEHYLEYNDKKMTSYNDCAKALGDNYIEGLPYLGRTNTITFIDRINDIKLIFINSKDDMSVYVQRLNDKEYMTSATPILKYRYDPLNVCSSLQYHLQYSNFYFNSVDYYSLPIYFTLVTWPVTLLLTLYKTKLKIIFMIINILLFVLYGYLFLNILCRGLMSV